MSKKTIVRKDNKGFSNELKRRIYKFIIELVKFTESLSKNDPLCRIAINQLLTSGTSMGANYVEAIAGSSKKDFTNFLTHCLKSSNESKFLISANYEIREKAIEKRLTYFFLNLLRFQISLVKVSKP